MTHNEITIIANDALSFIKGHKSLPKYFTQQELMEVFSTIIAIYILAKQRLENLTDENVGHLAQSFTNITVRRLAELRKISQALEDEAQASRSDAKVH